MGREVLRLVLEDDALHLAGAFASPSSAGLDAGALVGGAPCGVTVRPIGPALADADVVVDFSLPEALLGALPHLGQAALVSGTTGLDPDAIHRVQRHRGPVLLASNFSTGVNVLMALVERAARSLPSFDVEIVEAHHRRKVDAPSGTALALARTVATARGVEVERALQHGRVGRTGAREPGTIGIHALRGGSVTGHHAVWLAGEGERLVLTHEASSRTIFARGAIRAAKWIARKAPGCYTMGQVLGL